MSLVRVQLPEPRFTPDFWGFFIVFLFKIYGNLFWYKTVKIVKNRLKNGKIFEKLHIYIPEKPFLARKSMISILFQIDINMISFNQHQSLTHSGFQQILFLTHGPLFHMSEKFFTIKSTSCTNTYQFLVYTYVVFL